MYCIFNWFTPPSEHVAHTIIWTEIKINIDQFFYIYKINQVILNKVDEEKKICWNNYIYFQLNYVKSSEILLRIGFNVKTMTITPITSAKNDKFCWFNKEWDNAYFAKYKIRNEN